MNGFIRGIFVLGISLSAILGNQVHADLLNFYDVPGGSIQDKSGAMLTYKSGDMLTYKCGDMLTYQGLNFTATLDWIDLNSASWKYGARSSDFGLLIEFTFHYR